MKGDSLKRIGGGGGGEKTGGRVWYFWLHALHLAKWVAEEDGEETVPLGHI
jgi:hypothetical protein